MAFLAEARPTHVTVLEEDPDLGAGLGGEELAAAMSAAVTRSLALAPGPWVPPNVGAGAEAMLGLLVLEGLLIRSIEVGDRRSIELLGDGDLLRPWQRDVEDGPLNVPASWHVLKPARLAVLDGSFAVATARWPTIGAALTGRALRRARWNGILAALAQITRVDGRALLAFWYLAERWGRVRPDGVLVTLPLTHEQLGALIGARRPSVTTALSVLGERGLLLPVARGQWLLTPAAREIVERAGGSAPGAAPDAPRLAA